MHQGGRGGEKGKYGGGARGGRGKSVTPRHGNGIVYQLPGRRDGTQCAVSSNMPTDVKFVRFAHEMVDTMMAQGLAYPL